MNIIQQYHLIFLSVKDLTPEAAISANYKLHNHYDL